MHAILLKWKVLPDQNAQAGSLLKYLRSLDAHPNPTQVLKEYRDADPPLPVFIQASPSRD